MISPGSRKDFRAGRGAWLTRLYWFSLGAAILLAAAPIPAGAPGTPLKVASLEITSDAGIYVAIEKGYFRQEGITVELSPFNTASRQILPLVQGSLDIGGGAVAAALFNAVAEMEEPIRIVSEKGSGFKDRSASALAVRKDLMDSGRVKDFKDFKGLTVAVSSFASAPHIELLRGLGTAGLTEKDIRIIELSFPNMATAFANKAIDAAMFQEPLTTMSAEQGISVRWKLAYDLYPNHTVGVVLYSPQVVKNRPEEARRYMVAYLRGVRDYNDAFMHGKGKSEMVGILTRYTRVKDAKIYDKMVPSGLSGNGTVNRDGIAYDQEWYFQRGQVKKKVNIDKLVDESFLQYALSRIGRVPD